MIRSAFAFCFLASAFALWYEPVWASSSSPPGPAADFPSLDSYYPMSAVRAGQQGTATIHVCVDAVGKLTEPPTLVDTSGNDALDTGAIALANAGNGHYKPAMKDGVAVPGCGSYRIAFKLRGNAGLPVRDPRFPIIGARITKLNDELIRRVQDRFNELGHPPLMDSAFLSAGPAAERMIRQYARACDSYLDEIVGITADFLDDVDYLQESPDIPESERLIFRMEWPDNRSALVAQFRETLGTVREIVRVTDELGDYVAFSVSRRTANDAAAAQTPAEDPQLRAIRERARAAIEKLENTMKSEVPTSSATSH